MNPTKKPSIAYLHAINADKQYNKKRNNGSYNFLDGEIGELFYLLDENYTGWYANNFGNPDLLCFNGKYYRFGKDGYHKSTLNDLEEVSNPFLIQNPVLTKKEMNALTKNVVKYTISEVQTYLYRKLDKLIDKPVETTNEQLCTCKLADNEAVYCCKDEGKPYTGKCMFD